jgi:ribokinase
VTLGAGGVVVLARAGSGLARSAARSEAAATVAALAVGPIADLGVSEPCEDDTEAAAAAGAAAAAASAAEAGAADGAPADAARVGDYRIWEVPADIVATIDSTGAGDAFCGALAAALAEGRPLAEAVQRAVAGGALATTHVGAREGMPTAAELEEFLAARPVG